MKEKYNQSVYRILKRFVVEEVHGGDFDQGQSLTDTINFLKKWWNNKSKTKYMRDHYMNHENVVDRLVTEYKLHGDLIVAYDFDNTVFDYHNRGESYEMVIELIRKLGKVPGIELIVWTGSAKERYDFVKEYLDKNEIPFHKINENPSFFNSSSPKIFYSILIDDRAGMESAYEALVDFLDRINHPLIKK